MITTKKVRRRKEISIEDEVCDCAEALGFEQRKFECRRGDPDRIFLYGTDSRVPAEIFFIEFKRPGETLESHQRRLHETWTLMGIPVYTVDNFDAAEKILLAHMAVYSFRMSEMLP